MSNRATREYTSTLWVLEMRAISSEEPSRLLQILSGAILGCGGWVIHRAANGIGTVDISFEFERQASLEIYSVLVATGVELGQSGHNRFLQLCQCTRDRLKECGTEIACVNLEIVTDPAELIRSSRAGHPVEELTRQG